LSLTTPTRSAVAVATAVPGPAAPDPAAPGPASASLSKEQRLIAAIAGADWSPGAKRTWPAEMFAGLDWAAIPTLAWQYKMRPMVAAALRETGWAGVPVTVRAEIEAAERTCSLKAMRQLKLLAAIASTCDAAGIRVMTLKGIPLSLHFYSNPFLREAFDLDLLVHPDDWPRCELLLAGLGCAPLVQRRPLTPRQEGLLQRFRYHIKLLHREFDTVVEAHWRLDSNPYFLDTDFDALWRERGYVRFSGTTVAILGVENLLEYVALHASKHGWERWKWLADVVAILRPLSGDELLQCRSRAIARGNGDLFDSTVLLAHTITGFDFPAPLLDAAGRNRKALSLSRAALRLCVRSLTLAGITSRSYTQALNLNKFRLRRTPRFLLFELQARFYREDDWYALRLPDRWLWLCYCARPVSFLLRVWRGQPA
jgi:hypothetical protein